MSHLEVTVPDFKLWWVFFYPLNFWFTFHSENFNSTRTSGSKKDFAWRWIQSSFSHRAENVEKSLSNDLANQKNLAIFLIPQLYCWNQLQQWRHQLLDLESVHLHQCASIDVIYQWMSHHNVSLHVFYLRVCSHFK